MGEQKNAYVYYNNIVYFVFCGLGFGISCSRDSASPGDMIYVKGITRKKPKLKENSGTNMYLDLPYARIDIPQSVVGHGRDYGHQTFDKYTSCNIVF